MVLLVTTLAELDLVKARIVGTAANVARETCVTVLYTVGTMIELPRAALKTGEVAGLARFFSVGNKDLIQTRLGISLGDAASFLSPYTAKNIKTT